MKTISPAPGGAFFARELPYLPGGPGDVRVISLWYHPDVRKRHLIMSTPNKKIGSITRETEAATANGYLMFVVGVAFLVAAFLTLRAADANSSEAPFISGLIIALLGIATFRGLFMLQPNQAAL